METDVGLCMGRNKTFLEAIRQGSSCVVFDELLFGS